MEKFKKGDLVETPDGTRFFYMGKQDDMTSLVSPFMHCDKLDWFEFATSCLTKKEKLMMVNGYKVPTPLTSDFKDNHPEISVYISQFDGAKKVKAKYVPDCTFNTGLVFEHENDSLTMSKALLSAIPKEGE